jgi:hypothetical protein
VTATDAEKIARLTGVLADFVKGFEARLKDAGDREQPMWLTVIYNKASTAIACREGE